MEKNNIFRILPIALVALSALVVVIILFSYSSPELRGGLAGWWSRISWLSCSDSDAGQNYYVYGRVTAKFLSRNKIKTQTYTDLCFSEKQLGEYFCSGNKYGLASYVCPEGCSNGICTACKNDCSSDGAKTCSGNGYQVCGNYDYDLCLEWSPVINCPTGQVCQNSACTAGTYLPLINGVNSIYSLGTLSPLSALNQKVMPIVSGDNDTTPLPSTVALASGSGSGRVVALSGGPYNNDALNLFSNKQFVNNIFDWLNGVLNKKNILIDIGHKEWGGGSNFDSFKAELESRGYKVSRYSGLITPSILSTASVFFIDTAWGDFSQAEIDALNSFVDNGGGLLLAGVGWSWEPYNPGRKLDDYPMNVIGKRYGIRWSDGLLNDPTNNYQGGPIFHTFYPNIEIQTIYQAFSYIEKTIIDNPTNLPDMLETNNDLAIKFINANLLLANETKGLSQLSPQRQEIYDFYKRLITNYPQYFAKDVVFKPGRMAWLRERAFRNFMDALELTALRKSEIASAIKLSGRYLDIWNNFGVMLLDNTKLTDKQKNFIYNFLNLLPEESHNLRVISVVDNLGNISPAIDLGGIGGGVNIFAFDIGTYNENSFPADVSAGLIDTFSVAVAHEVNHTVDAFYVANNSSLKEKKNKLIADAGCIDLNYLRSNVTKSAGSCFFVNAPQEFFASMANQWFADSKKTIDLGVIRFNNGYSQPLSQALFFADVYSMANNFTYFYTTDTQGNITRQTISLTRDVNRRIISLTVNSQVYNFSYDSSGNIKEINTSTASIMNGLNPIFSGGLFGLFPPLMTLMIK